MKGVASPPFTLLFVRPVSEKIREGGFFRRSGLKFPDAAGWTGRDVSARPRPRCSAGAVPGVADRPAASPMESKQNSEVSL